LKIDNRWDFETTEDSENNGYKEQQLHSGGHKVVALTTTLPIPGGRDRRPDIVQQHSTYYSQQVQGIPFGRPEGVLTHTHTNKHYKFDEWFYL